MQSREYINLVQNQFETISLEQLFCSENKTKCSSLFSFNLQQSIKNIDETNASCKDELFLLQLLHTQSPPKADCRVS